MNIENILNNNEYKILFLKAVILGINYGKSNNSDYYLDNIEKEIIKLNNLNHLNILTNLENQKTYTSNLINYLINQNYVLNYSKINLLKTKLNDINSKILKHNNDRDLPVL